MNPSTVKNEQNPYLLSPQEVKILIVDDNASHGETLQEAMKKEGYQVELALLGKEALQILDEKEVDIVITDLKIDQTSGMDILKKAKTLDDPPEVILITGYASVETAVEAMKQGALDYLEKPINLKVLRAKVAKAVERIGLRRSNLNLQKQLQEKFYFEGIIGRSLKMKKVIEKLIHLAPNSDATVLITGENGTGKELVAKTIHNHSSRKKFPFVVINCAAIPENLLESELFGTVSGAFTNAKDRKGKIEYANRGTLFLDEIGDMPPILQAKLLRVLEEKEVSRLGSNKTIKVDVRFLAATNRDLYQAVQEGRFRQDLYYRLRVVTIHLPPLRERKEDIPILVDHFIQEFAQKYQKTVKAISPSVKMLFSRYTWPGNVRELRNCIESMVLISQKEILDLEDVPEWIYEGEENSEIEGTQKRKLPLFQEGLIITPGYTMDNYEREIIRSTLEMTKGNRAEAAKILNIGERTLYRKLKKYNIS